MERYRVVLPLTNAAKIVFERNTDFDLGNQATVLDIGNRFSVLYQAGVLAAIGKACCQPIDEYEETTIAPDRLGCAALRGEHADRKAPAAHAGDHVGLQRGLATRCPAVNDRPDFLW